MLSLTHVRRAMIGLISVLIAALVAGVVGVSSAAAQQDSGWGGQDYLTRAIPGLPLNGNPFSLRCAPGDYLVGLSGRSGSSVDAVAPLCANWDAVARTFLPPGEGPMQGGGGGVPIKVACSPRALVISIVVDRNQREETVADWIGVVCADPLSGKTERPATHFASLGANRGRWLEGDGYTRRWDFYDPDINLRCERGDVAVGIHGRAGRLVDRIGLICAPAPRAAPPPPPKVVLDKSVGVVASQAPHIPGARPGAPVLAPGAAPVLAPGIAAAIGAPGAVAAIAPPGAAVAGDRDACKDGFVWREARDGDRVCVTPEARTLAALENDVAASRVDPAGAYGPSTCKSGFVWREAAPGDVTCVTPERRDAVRAENAAAASRRVGP
ncbi:MAG: hypothetical protein KJS97_09550 [Alphaproteobacteria bacterium]|nr:hypothetical protein [Alphaproteobacteria bacterium]